MRTTNNSTSGTMSVTLMCALLLTFLSVGTAASIIADDHCGCEFYGEWDGDSWVSVICTNWGCTASCDEDGGGGYTWCWCLNADQVDCNCYGRKTVATGAMTCIPLHPCNFGTCKQSQPGTGGHAFICACQG